MLKANVPPGDANHDPRHTAPIPSQGLPSHHHTRAAMRIPEPTYPLSTHAIPATHNPPHQVRQARHGTEPG
eukprot:2586982-Rhodomonas_salina.3